MAFLNKNCHKICFSLHAGLTESEKLMKANREKDKGNEVDIDVKH